MVTKKDIMSKESGKYMKIIENQNNEFKRLLNDKFEKEVVSFLNSKEGGNIYLGIEDNGEVLGIANTDETQLEIKDRIKNNVSPSTLGLFDVVLEEIEEKNVIHVVIASGSEKPYYINKKGMSPQGCFIRIGSSAETMTKEMIQNLYTSRTKNSLKSIVSPTQNLTFSQLKIFYEEAGFDIGSNFLHQLELINDEGKYNYVAYLLSDSNSISIKIAKYQGDDSYNLIENDDYGYCSLIKATKNVLARLEIENRTFTKITSSERREIKKLDSIALREAVVNAIVHNDYTYEHAAKFELFDDRIEISSYGGLPERYSKEDFFEGFSAPKNKEIMRVFKDIGLVEQLGTGIRRILKIYDSNVYEFFPNNIRVTFKFRDNFSNEILESTHYKPNFLQNEILGLLAIDRSMTQESIAERLSVSKRTVIRHMNVLEEMKYIKREGDNRTGHWILLMKEQK